MKVKHSFSSFTVSSVQVCQLMMTHTADGQKYSWSSSMFSSLTVCSSIFSCAVDEKVSSGDSSPCLSPSGEAVCVGMTWKRWILWKCLRPGRKAVASESLKRCQPETLCLLKPASLRSCSTGEIGDIPAQEWL